MGQKKKEKVLGIFFENPDRKFTIREISNLVKIPRATVHKILTELNKEMLLKNNQAVSSLIFKTKKINYFVDKIVESGLIEEFIKKLNPSCIILFGSIRKGDSVKESDIDLFVESPVKTRIELNRFERRLKHNIQLFVESNMNKLPAHLFNNVVNGIKLYGSFKIK